jgi:hypothetical protein
MFRETYGRLDDVVVENQKMAMPSQNAVYSWLKFPALRMWMLVVGVFVSRNAAADIQLIWLPGVPRTMIKSRQSCARNP